MSEPLSALAFSEDHAYESVFDARDWLLNAHIVELSYVVACRDARYYGGVEMAEEAQDTNDHLALVIEQTKKSGQRLGCCIDRKQALEFIKEHRLAEAIALCLIPPLPPPPPEVKRPGARSRPSDLA